jgi:C-terminal processing protease CtpA/Prc
MFATVDSLPVQRTIVDLRFNNGGDNSIFAPLEHALKDRSKFSSHGRLYTLISWQTTSSGMDAAADLRNRLHAILVGEPIGEKPNTYAEVRNFTLPNSGLVVWYSTKFFSPVKDSDPLTLAPDIFITRSIEDYLGGRDPVLEAALHHPLQ